MLLRHAPAEVPEVRTQAEMTAPLVVERLAQALEVRGRIRSIEALGPDLVHSISWPCARRCR
jgi:hypothetical protein